MTQKDIDRFVSNELLLEINGFVKNYIEDKYSYIETADDLEDLEYAEVDDELIGEVIACVHNLIEDCSNDYDFENIDEVITEELIYTLADAAFTDCKEMLLEKYHDDFERACFFDDYYADRADELF